MAELVSLSDYPDQFQAEAIRIRLAAAGIQVIVTGTDAATALSMGGAGTDRLVRVEVAKSDYEQAMKLLIEDEARLASASPWICSRCDEQNEPAFEVCWGCNKTQSDGDKLGRREEPGASTKQDSVNDGTSQTKRASLGTTNDSNPFRPVLIDRDSKDFARTANDNRFVPTEEQEETVRRAFLASVAALLLLPPLVSFYSVYILCGLGTQAFKYPPFRPRLVAAWSINVIVISLGTVFWVFLFRSG